MARAIIVACFLSAAAVVGGAHVCRHSSPEIQTSFAQITKREVKTRMFEGQAADPEPLRIGFNFDNLVATKYCSSAGIDRPFIAKPSPGDFPCPEYSVYYPNTMDSVLKDYVMPKAKDIIEASYKVVPLSSIPHVPGDCGPNVVLPAAATTGVDMLIFVTAGVMPSPSYENTLAYAYTCTSDLSTGRPITGVINFNPKYLSWNSNFNVFDNDELVNTAVHEIHHAMGFNSGNLLAKSADVTVRDKTVKAVKSPKVVEKAKEFFQCDTLTFLEIEDEGGSGTQYGHWDRRVAFEEIMVGTGGGKLSSLTMAFMEDLGYYTPVYDASKKMAAGNASGCGFVQSKCNTAEGGRGSVWYFDSDYRCSPDRKMLTKYSWGPTSSAIPSQFVYDSENPTFASSPSGLTDMCPYGIRVTQSECAWQTTAVNTGEYASYPGIGSRCFETSGIRVDGSSTTVSYNSRCMQARCPFGGTRVEFQLGGKWIACPLDGSSSSGLSTPSGFTGTVDCPEAKYICDEEISTGSSEREPKASGTSSIIENKGYSTLTLTLIFNGTEWESALSSENRIGMLNHIRQDVAYYLKTSSANLRIRRITPSKSDVTVIFGLGENAYSNELLTGAFNLVFGTGEFFNYTRETYAGDSERANAESPYIALASFYIDEPGTDSLCGTNLSQEKCVTVIAVCLFSITVIVLLVVVWCVCLRNPFKRKIKPNHAYKYNTDKI